MDRLTSELARLYFAPGTGALAAPDGRVRAIVLELAAWPDASRVWQGVQADLDLPAPAIAVNGSDACQLWFSLAEPVDAARARDFLAGLRTRYLAAVPPERVRLQPAVALPPVQVGEERWSAFVAPDLAPLFAEEPWLDHPPGQDAQADLLSRVTSAKPEVFHRAGAKLSPAPGAPDTPAQAASPSPADPRAFLLSVMQDPSVDLRLRIEAAKALLPFTELQQR